MTVDIRSVKICPFTRSERHIEAIGRLQPLLDKANSTQDESILLETAQACEEANLPTLAEMYRKRAGCRKPTDREVKKSLAEKALQIISDKGQITCMELQYALGITRREWYPIAGILRKAGKVDFIHHTHYVLKQEKLF